jgi:hypothetical protein
MGLFNKTPEKLGFDRSAKAEPPPQDPPSPQTKPATPVTTAPSTASDPIPIAVVDVVAQLEKLAASHAEKLNWKVSIVDLLKLLGLESSFAARKEHAVELSCPPEKMDDSAQMNIWLRMIVLQRIADNGSNIPEELLD